MAKPAIILIMWVYIYIFVHTKTLKYIIVLEVHELEMQEYKLQLVQEYCNMYF